MTEFIEARWLKQWIARLLESAAATVIEVSSCRLPLRLVTAHWASRSLRILTDVVILLDPSPSSLSIFLLILSYFLFRSFDLCTFLQGLFALSSTCSSHPKTHQQGPSNYCWRFAPDTAGTLQLVLFGECRCQTAVRLIYISLGNRLS